jgi:hypothetical protein
MQRALALSLGATSPHGSMRLSPVRLKQYAELASSLLDNRYYEKFLHLAAGCRCHVANRDKLLT